MPDKKKKEKVEKGEKSPAKGSTKSKGFVSALDMEDVPMGLPDHLQTNRTRVICGNAGPTQTQSTLFSGAYAASGVDNSLDYDRLQADFTVDIKELTEEKMEVDLVGLDAAVVNAYRRILISEVPTMAIEKVFVANNTSIMQDEVLAHRLGLVPLLVDPVEFAYRDNDGVANEGNTIVFKLKVKCTRDAEGELVNSAVTSSMLEWLPGGSQFPEDSDTKLTAFMSQQSTKSGLPIRPVHNDILLLKLRPGQELELECHAVKGIGKTHAKWSPVATAFYRLLPEVILKQPIKGADAEALVAKCPKKVFDIEDLGGGKKQAVAARSRDCTICRECIREPGWDEKVQLQRVRDHFIFTVESVGQLPPERLFADAVSELHAKCERVLALSH